MDLFVLDMLAQASPGLFGPTGLGTLGLAGGGIGAIVGGVAGLIQSHQARKQASRTRRRLRRFQRLAEARGLSRAGDILAGAEQSTIQNFLGGIFGFQPQSPAERLFGAAGTGGGFFSPAGGVSRGPLSKFSHGMAQGVGQNIQRELNLLQLVRQGAGRGQFTEKQLAGRERAARRNLSRLADEFEGLSAGQRRVALENLGGFSLEEFAELAGRNPEVVIDGAEPGIKPNRPVSAGGSAGPSFGLNPLAQNVQRGVEQALATRGLSGGRAAAFTSGLAGGFQNFQTQLSLLPLLQQQSVLPLGLSGGIQRQQFQNLAAPLLQAPFGQTPLSGSVAGGLAGFGAGSSIGLNLAQLASRERGGGDTEFDDIAVEVPTIQGPADTELLRRRTFGGIA